MGGEVAKIDESNNYSPEQVRETKIIDRKDVKDVQSLKDYYNGAPEEEKQKLVKEFKSYVEPDLKQAPRLNGSVEEEESSELWEDEFRDLNELQEFRQVFEKALDDHPNTDWASRVAIDNMVYRHMRDSEDQIKETVEKSASDKNIDKDK